MNPEDFRAKLMRIATGGSAAEYKRLTVADVAGMLGIKPGTLRTWRHQGVTPKLLERAERCDGKSYTYDPLLVMEFLAERDREKDAAIRAREQGRALGPGRRTPSPRRHSDA